jgi:hypothetical protein
MKESLNPTERDLYRGNSDFLWRVAYKSLARPRRKQATATKLRIYSTFSPWISIHFLARCSFTTHLKKIRGLSVQPGICGSKDFRIRQKWWPFNCFSVQGIGGSPTGPDPNNRVGDQEIGTQVGQFLLGCKCPVSRGIVVQEEDPLGELPATFFL